MYGSSGKFVICRTAQHRTVQLASSTQGHSRQTPAAPPCRACPNPIRPIQARARRAPQSLFFGCSMYVCKSANCRHVLYMPPVPVRQPAQTHATISPFVNYHIEHRTGRLNRCSGSIVLYVWKKWCCGRGRCSLRLGRGTEVLLGVCEHAGGMRGSSGGAPLYLPG